MTEYSLLTRGVCCGNGCRYMIVDDNNNDDDADYVDDDGDDDDGQLNFELWIGLNARLIVICIKNGL
jgi:hypothetical protein